MRRNCFVILVLCISIFLSGCNIIEESTTSTESTVSSESSETSTTSPESTTSTSSETEPSVTYESVSIPEGLTREEIYEDVGQTLLCYWSKYYYLDNESHIYLREYSEFNETMMLEVLWLAYQLYIPTIQGQRPRIFDYCHCNDADGVLLYTIQAMHFIFGQDISAEEMMAMIPGTSEDSYVMRYDEGYDSIISARVSLIDISAEITDTNVAEGNYDFTTDCSIVSYDDTSCTYDVYWVPGSSGEHLPNGRFAPVRDIATITVTFDFDDSYDLGFIITNIQVERAQ
ncbi:MAG TPA: hypothetical protein PLM10_02900 [Saccharofermentans sp.]|nr:hypothetical protein [Saccharofermentans sp.]HRV51355.1 hypothetical protein [Saccharofermentans sp.]